jgi:hypothetical protein
MQIPKSSKQWDLDLNTKIYVDYNLWDIITNEITNYWRFREKLQGVLDEVLKEENLKNSIGKVVSDLIEKAYEFIEKFSNMNPDDIEKLGQTGVQLIERLEESSVLKNPSDVAEIAKPILEEQAKGSKKV